MFQHLISGTITATSSGVAIPLQAALLPGINNYQIQFRSMGTPDAVFMPPGASASAQFGLVSGGSATSGTNVDTRTVVLNMRGVSTDPKIYAASSCVVYYTIYFFAGE